MANLSDLNTIITELFGVLGTVINEVVDLITGDLLVLVIVGAFITMIVGVVYGILRYVRKSLNMNTRMK